LRHGLLVPFWARFFRLPDLGVEPYLDLVGQTPDGLVREGLKGLRLSRIKTSTPS